MLPLLNRPGARLHDSGHVRSIPPGNSEGALGLGVVTGVTALAGVDGLGVSGR